MADGPQLVKELGDGWSLKQWSYDGPLELHGHGLVFELKGDEIELEVQYTEYGCCSSYDTQLYKTVPLRVLKSLLEESRKL